jgi:hypothetical protein
MVVDPEKPSGYNGGDAAKMDADVLSKLRQETVLSGDDRELRAYAGNPVGGLLKDEGVTDLDEIIGWSRERRAFIPYSLDAEMRRLRGYANH